LSGRPAARFFAASLALALALVSATPAVACSPPPPRTFRQALAEAKHVFIFRLDEAAYEDAAQDKAVYTPPAKGRIRLVQTLYGNPTHIRNIRYFVGWCGGLQLSVGHHYLVATREGTDTLFLEPSDGSILDVEGLIDPESKDRTLHTFVVQQVIRAIYRKRPLPTGFPSPYLRRRTVPHS
jgi:hypothetical protein